MIKDAIHALEIQLSKLSFLSPQAVDSLSFFLVESVYILMLVLLVSFLMGLVKPLFPIMKIKNWLSNSKYKWLGYPMAAFFGAVTPFCSCSSTPLFIGFLEANIPLGVAFSFLITSPLINEIALALFIGSFGLKIAVMYVAAGMFIGIFGGMLIQKLKLESWVADFVWKAKSRAAAQEETGIALGKRFSLAKDEAFGISRKIFPYVLAGIGVGSVIHGFVPESFFQSSMAEASWATVPAAALIGVPLYSSASAIVPVVESIVAKGIPLGTAMAFMLAAVGLSTPEAIILKKVMDIKLLLVFFGIVSIGIILVGYLFNIM